jgi:hypothetical protein
MTGTTSWFSGKATCVRFIACLAPVSVCNGIECATRRARSFWDTPLAASIPTLFAE